MIILTIQLCMDSDVTENNACENHIQTCYRKNNSFNTNIDNNNSIQNCISSNSNHTNYNDESNTNGDTTSTYTTNNWVENYQVHSFTEGHGC